MAVRVALELLAQRAPVVRIAPIVADGTVEIGVAEPLDRRDELAMRTLSRPVRTSASGTPLNCS
jgi:hypothetical protein